MSDDVDDGMQVDDQEENDDQGDMRDEADEGADDAGGAVEARPTVDVPAHQIRREYKVWRAAVPFLYDLVLYQGMIWPSTVVTWLPASVPNAASDVPLPTIQHCLVGSNTSGSDQPYLQVVPLHLTIRFLRRLTIVQVMEITLPPKYDYALRDDVSRAHSSVTSTAGKIRAVKAFHSTTDIRRVRVMPRRASLAACKCDDSLTIDLFDISQPGVAIPTRTTPAASAPFRTSKLLSLSGHTADGWGLSWASPHLNGQVISGSNDTLICHWDVNSPGDASAIAPLRTYAGHAGPVIDVHWGALHAHVFASGSDDKTAAIWDVREKGPSAPSTTLAHAAHVNAVEWAPFDEFQLATGTAEGTVAVWDTRKPDSPAHVLQCGKGPHDITRVSWAPFQPGLLATSGNNRRVLIWDLSRVGMEQSAEDAEEGPPELAFVHSGHTASVTDVEWCPDSPWTIASVSENNILEVWEVADPLRSAPTRPESS